MQKLRTKLKRKKARAKTGPSGENLVGEKTQLRYDTGRFVCLLCWEVSLPRLPSGSVEIFRGLKCSMEYCWREGESRQLIADIVNGLSNALGLQRPLTSV